jgi:hypothetical protein
MLDKNIMIKYFKNLRENYEELDKIEVPEKMINNGKWDVVKSEVTDNDIENLSKELNI